MNDNTLHNIHDTFFRDTLSRKEIAADFLQNYLPAHILQHLELDSLIISKDTFVDAQHMAHYSDVLYQVSLKKGEKGFVYVLFEHKSSPDAFTSLQLLKYMIEIWELFRKQRKRKTKLPLIIPVIVYHGKTKGKAVRLADLVHIPDERLRGYVPDFDMNFHDFSPKADEVIKGQMLLQSALYCLKVAHHKNAPSIVLEIFKCIGRLDDDEYTLQWVRMVWQYVSETVNMEPKEVFEIAKQNLSGKKDGEVMTIAQRLEQLGEARGEARGMAMGSTGILVRQLTRKFGAQTLTPAVQVRLQSASIDQLDYWGERILDAKSIREVFGDNA